MLPSCSWIKTDDASCFRADFSHSFKGQKSLVFRRLREDSDVDVGLNFFGNSLRKECSRPLVCVCVCVCFFFFFLRLSVTVKELASLNLMEK